MKRFYSIAFVLFLSMSLSVCFSNNKDTSVVVVEIPPQLFFGHLKHLCYMSYDSCPSAFSLETYIALKDGWRLKLNPNPWMYSKDYSKKILRLNTGQKIEFIKKSLETLSKQIDMSGNCLFSFLNSDFPELSILWSRNLSVRDLMAHAKLADFNNRLKNMIQESEIVKSLQEAFVECGFAVSDIEVSHVYTIDNIQSIERFVLELPDFYFRPDDKIFDCDITIHLTKLSKSIHSF